MSKLLAWLGGAVLVLLGLLGYQHERGKRKEAERKADALKGQKAIRRKTAASVKKSKAKGKKHVKKAVDRARTGKRDHFESQ